MTARQMSARRYVAGLTMEQKYTIVIVLEQIANGTREPADRDMRLCYNLDKVPELGFLPKSRYGYPGPDSYEVYSHLFNLCGYRGNYPLEDEWSPAFGGPWFAERGNLRRTLCGFMAARLIEEWGL